MKRKTLLIIVCFFSTSILFAQSDDSNVSPLSRKSFRHLLTYISEKNKHAEISYLTLSQQNDMIIGQTDPNEVVTITEHYFLDGNLTIVNNGVLNINQADFQIDGDIFIAGKGQLNLNGGSFTVIQEYIYEHDAIVIDNGRIEFSGVKFQSSGQSWSIGLTGNAQYILEDSEISDGFITTALLENSTARITHTKTPGEFLCFDNNGILFRNSDFLLQWLVLPDSSIVEVSLPDDSLLTGWHFSVNDSNIRGIPYSIEIDSCTQVMWGLISTTGSDATFRNTELRTIGLLFTDPDSIAINNITNESRHSDNIIDVPDRTLRLINSNVHTWSFYVSSNSNITVNNCIFGELLAQDSSSVHINNSVCDGTGGYLGAFHQSFMLVVGSLIRSQVISRQTGVLVGAESAFLGTEIDADESSIMFLANTTTNVEPEAHNSAIIFEAQMPPVEGVIDSQVPIIGTARLLAGPDNPTEFTGYTVEYSPDPENPAWLPTDGKHPDPVTNDTLAVWDTSGLISGDYGLQLSLFHSLGDSIYMGSYAWLDRITAIFSEDEKIPQNVALEQNYPNPFNAQTIIRYQLRKGGRVFIEIYNTLGQRVKTLVDSEKEAGYYSVIWDGNNDLGESITSGTYVCQMNVEDFIDRRKILFLK